MKYTIVKHIDPPFDYTECVDENGQTHRFDLTTDASFSEIEEALKNRAEGVTYKEVIDSFSGKTFECERTFPYIPMHFVCGGRFIDQTSKH